MAAGSWLLALTRKRSHRLSSEAVHAALFRGVVVAWVIIAILVQPGWLPSGISPGDVDLPLLFLPAAALYFMLSAMSRWHARLGGRALARVFRVTSWLFPVVVICSRQTFWNITRMNVIGGLPRRGSELVWWGATGLFFVTAFLIGVTWYASLDAANEAPRRDDDQN